MFAQTYRKKPVYTILTTTAKNQIVSRHVKTSSLLFILSSRRQVYKNHWTLLSNDINQIESGSFSTCPGIHIIVNEL